jgi:CubicO group peptidase (beta-lactamase class C family)
MSTLIPRLLVAPMLAGVLALAANPALAGDAVLSTTSFAPVDARMQQMVTERNLGGASIMLLRNGEVLLERHYRSFTPETRIPIASASKWMAGAVIAGLIDRGVWSLDDNIGRFVPDAPPDKRGITIRQLFAHTSGIPGNDSQGPRPGMTCVANRATTLEACMREILATPLDHPPGSTFDYGSGSMHVAGRLAEIATGKTWDQLFDEIVARPLGLVATDFGAGSGLPGIVASTNPRIDGGVRSTLRDYARFLDMIASNGVHEGRQILSPAVIAEMERDQTFGAPGRPGEFLPYALGYGVGVWRVRVGADGQALQVASQGAFGHSPWVDRDVGLVGVIAVLDQFTRLFFDVQAIWTLARESAATLPPAGQQLSVTGGWNGGVVAPGTVRDVFAEAPSATRQFVAWRGDTTVLDDPRAWHARLTMPDRPIRLTAEYRDVSPLVRTVTSINGRRAEYALPPDPKGVIVVFHGTNGSSRVAFDGDRLDLTEYAVANGYAVVALDSNDRDARQWATAFSMTNIDVINTIALLDRLTAEGLLRPGLPRFALGVSNGGGFASRISALLGWRAQNIVIATGIEPVMAQTSVPTIWSLTRRDPVLPLDAVATAQRHANGLVQRRIAAEVNVLEPTPVYPERFTRIRGLSVDDSRAIQASLRAADLLDAESFVRQHPRTNEAAVAAAIPAAYASFRPAIEDQLNLAWAGHETMSDFRHRVIHFFDAHLAPNWTGLWGDTSEPGWGISLMHQGPLLGPIWYTYASDGRPEWWLVSGAFPQPDGSFVGPVFRFTGTPFPAISGPASRPGTEIGSARFLPLDSERLEFRVTIDGIARTRVLTRYGSGMPPLCRFVTGSRAAAANRTDTWAATGEDGWGIHLTEFAGGLLFGVWYTYAEDGRALWMSSLMRRQPGGQFTGEVNRAASGVPFDRIAGPATSFPIPSVGEAEVRFTDGERAEFRYRLGTVDQVKPLIRVRFAPEPVSECQ